jgi:hypothetical protein
MKAPPSWSGNVLHGQLQERNQRSRPPLKAKDFDTLVARYYPAVYSFACRFTDDGRNARALTRDAFDSTRKQLQTCRDENVLASILISNAIRAGLRPESNLAQTAQPKTRNAFGFGSISPVGSPGFLAVLALAESHSESNPGSGQATKH